VFNSDRGENDMHANAIMISAGCSLFLSDTINKNE